MKTKTIAFTLACAFLKVKIVIWMKRFKKEKKKKKTLNRLKIRDKQFKKFHPNAN